MKSMSDKQRVSEKDAEIMLDKLVKEYRDSNFPATTYVEDYAGGSLRFINEKIVRDLIKKLCNP